MRHRGFHRLASLDSDIHKRRLDRWQTLVQRTAGPDGSASFFSQPVNPKGANSYSESVRANKVFHYLQNRRRPDSRLFRVHITIAIVLPDNAKIIIMARKIKDFIPDSNWEASPFAYWIFDEVDSISDYELESWLRASPQIVSDRKDGDRPFLTELPENGKAESGI